MQITEQGNLAKETGNLGKGSRISISRETVTAQKVRENLKANKVIFEKLG